MSKCFSTNACYAALIAGFSDNNIDYAFLRIVLALINLKHYPNIDINTLCKDFFNKFNFELPYFPMQRILNIAAKRNFLAYSNSTGKYMPNYENICKDDFMSLMDSKERELNDLISTFNSYVYKKYEFNYSYDDSIEIIDSFVIENGINYYCQRKTLLDKAQKYYFFSEFLLSSETNPFYREYVDSLVVGRILAELVTYNETSENIKYQDIIVFIDTGVAFRLLGIDNLNRKQIYINLITDIQKLGIKIKMFHHSYNEMIGIINSSAMWIDNPNYDPSKASEATYYFVTNNYSQSKINELCNTIAQDLDDLGIIIENIDYPQVLPNGVLHEKNYYDNIIEYYKESNPDFDEEEKRYTVEQDARSFFYIDYLCKGIISNQIQDIKYIFITTNNSLAYVNRKIIHKRNGISNKSIPYCVTDVFWGNLIWANSPAKILENSKMRLTTQLYAAFLPSTEMLAKLTKSLIECEAKGILTAEECYMLKASKVANRSLMEITLGNEQSFVDRTPLMILQDIQLKAKEEGAIEERKLAEIEIKRKEQEVNEEKYKRIETGIREILTNIELNNKEIIYTKANNKILYIKTEELKKNAIKACRKLENKIRLFFAIIVGLVLLNLIIGIIIWLCSTETNYFELFAFASSFAYILAPYIYFIIKGKTFSITQLIKKYRADNFPKYYKKYHYSREELENVESEIKANNNKIDYCNNQLTILKNRCEAFETEKLFLSAIVGC